MKKIIEWVKKLLTDEGGKPSSKRHVGLMAAIVLCVALLINLFTNYPVDPVLVNAVAALAFGALGLSSVDKIWGKKTEE